MTLKKKIRGILDKSIKFLLFVWAFAIPISIGAMNVLAALLFLLFIANIILGKKYDLYSDEIDKGILLLSLFILISSIWAYNYFYVIEEFVSSILSYILMYFLILNIVQKKDIEKLLGLYWFSTIIAGLFAGYQHFFLNINRATGFTHNANRLGATMMMFIVFNFSILLFSKKNRYRIFSVLGLIIGTIGLFSSLSRSSLLSAMIALFIISIIKSKKNLIIYTILLTLLVYFLPEDYKMRLIQLTDLSSHNVSQRILMYKNGLKVFIDNFWLGIGFNNIELIYNHYNFNKITYDHVHLHNAIINFAVELGIFGLSGIIYLFYKVLKINILSILENSNFINIGILGIILAQFSYNMVDFNFHAPEVALITVFFVSIMIKQYNLKYDKRIIGGQ